MSRTEDAGLAGQDHDGQRLRRLLRGSHDQVRVAE